MAKVNEEADFYQDPDGLAKFLIEEVQDWIAEQKGYDENDHDYHYIAGLISARMTILGRLGYGEILDETVGDWWDGGI